MLPPILTSLNPRKNSTRTCYDYFQVCYIHCRWFECQAWLPIIDRTPHHRPIRFYRPIKAAGVTASRKFVLTADCFCRTLPCVKKVISASSVPFIVFDSDLPYRRCPLMTQINRGLSIILANSVDFNLFPCNRLWRDNPAYWMSLTAAAHALRSVAKSTRRNIWLLRPLRIAKGD